MPITEMDRLVAEVRELLASTKDKNAVLKVLRHRGMPADQAEEIVRAVFKQNLWDNRKTSLGMAVVSGLIAAGLIVVWITTDRLFYIWLPISLLAMLWGIIKCLTATGYEIEEGDD